MLRGLGQSHQENMWGIRFLVFDLQELKPISPEGHQIHYRNFIQRVFKKAAKNAGLPNITFHDLRRTHATILIASGASQKVVQERLGHRSISTTLALYAQGTEQGHTEASQATAKYIRTQEDYADLIRAH